MKKMNKYIDNINLKLLKGHNKSFNILVLKFFSKINFYRATLYLADYFYFKDNIDKSIHYYKKLIISEEYLDSIFGLARCYWKLALLDDSFGFYKAVRFYEIIGIHGNAIVQYWLGNAYLADKYNIKNEEMAFFWYNKSSENGVILAKYHLGICYLFGIGCISNYLEALRLFEDCYSRGKDEVEFYIDLCKIKIKEGEGNCFEV